MLEGMRLSIASLVSLDDQSSLLTEFGNKMGHRLREEPTMQPVEALRRDLHNLGMILLLTSVASTQQTDSLCSHHVFPLSIIRGERRDRDRR